MQAKPSQLSSHPKSESYSPSEEVEVPPTVPHRNLCKREDQDPTAAQQLAAADSSESVRKNIKKRRSESVAGVAGRVKRQRRAASGARYTNEDSDADDENPFTPGPKIMKSRPKASVSPHLVRKVSNSDGASNTRSHSTHSVKLIESATRVFAWWEADNQYYSGIVKANAPGSVTEYLITFDDGDQAQIDITKLRRCTLRIGDEVIVAKEKAHVIDVSDLSSRCVVSIRPEHEDDEDAVVNLRKIAIASRTIISHWKDRTLNCSEIVTADFLTGKQETGFNATVNSNTRRLMKKIGLLVSLSTKCDESEKARVSSSIKQAGGQHIEDWSELFSLEGTSTTKRWVGHADDIKWIGPDISKIFLLANEENQKPKYLIALALGVPCLNVSWLNEALALVSQTLPAIMNFFQTCIIGPGAVFI